MKHEEKQVKLGLARIAKVELDSIKYQLKIGRISYEEAKGMSSSPLLSFNEGMRLISQEHGFKHHNIGFARFMR